MGFSLRLLHSDSVGLMGLMGLMGAIKAREPATFAKRQRQDTVESSFFTLQMIYILASAPYLAQNSQGSIFQATKVKAEMQVKRFPQRHLRPADS